MRARGWVGRLNKSEREEEEGGSEKAEHQVQDMKGVCHFRLTTKAQ